MSTAGMFSFEGLSPPRATRCGFPAGSARARQGILRESKMRRRKSKALLGRPERSEGDEDSCP